MYDIVACNVVWATIRKLEKAVAVRNSLLEKFSVGSHLRTPGLRTENSSKKISVVLVNSIMDLLKRSSPYFFRQ